MLGRVAALDSKGLAQVALALSGLLSLGEVAVSMEGGAGGSAQCDAAGPVIAQLAFLGASGADLPLLAVSSGTASSGFRPPFALEAMHSSVAWGKGRVANAPVLIELAVKGGGGGEVDDLKSYYLEMRWGRLSWDKAACATHAATAASKAFCASTTLPPPLALAAASALRVTRFFLLRRLRSRS